MRKVVLCEGNNKMAICMEDCVFMKEIKTNVMRILDKEKVEYTHHEYHHGKDAVDGVTDATLMNHNPDYVFKTLVTKGIWTGCMCFHRRNYNKFQQRRKRCISSK